MQAQYYSSNYKIGPKSGPPRNLTVTEVHNGFLITWQAPLERAHLVQYYTIKYRTDAQWKTLNRGQIRPEETSYLGKESSLISYENKQLRLVLFPKCLNLTKFTRWKSAPDKREMEVLHRLPIEVS